MNVHTHELCTETHIGQTEPRWLEPHCSECGEAMRYSVVKLPGRREGWAVFDSTIDGTIVGTRSATRREAYEALAEHLELEDAKAAVR